MPLTLRFHDKQLSICKLDPQAPVSTDILAHPFTCFFRTHDEATLICPTALVPQGAKSESGFVPMQFVGPFDFALTGILTQVANPLATAGISIVALSTFDTDYVLIKADKRAAAKAVLEKAGHKFHE